jgi:hypothetical protein
MAQSNITRIAQNMLAQRQSGDPFGLAQGYEKSVKHSQSISKDIARATDPKLYKQATTGGALAIGKLTATRGMQVIVDAEVKKQQLKLGQHQLKALVSNNNHMAGMARLNLQATTSNANTASQMSVLGFQTSMIGQSAEAGVKFMVGSSQRAKDLI